jgi:hypothetical protein
MITYIPVSLVSALAGRHSCKRWQDAVLQLLQNYYPSILDEIDSLREEDSSDSEKEVTDNDIRIGIQEKSLIEYNETITNPIYVEPTSLDEQEKQLVRKDRGTFLETDTISRLVGNQTLKNAYNLPAIKINRQVGVSRSFTYVSNGTNIAYTISGAIDGVIWNKCILEIKNRCHHFMEPGYDIDQLTMYIVLFSIPLPGRLVQQYDGEICIGDEIPYKDAVAKWQNDIKPSLDKRLVKLNKKLACRDYQWFYDNILS